MNIHVLNGDALAQKFPFAEDIVVCREAMMDGPLTPPDLDTFWSNRAAFIADAFQADKSEYRRMVIGEFDKLVSYRSDDHFFLWFEHDLFCQVNLWFCIWFLHHHGLSGKVSIVYPNASGENDWSGFGQHSKEDLKRCFSKARQLTNDDVALARNLLDAYAKTDIARLLEISTTASASFPRLDAVCKAHADRLDPVANRPRMRLKQIKSNGVNNFHEIFAEFVKTEAVYGFGDTQVKALLDEM